MQVPAEDRRTHKKLLFRGHFACCRCGMPNEIGFDLLTRIIGALIDLKAKKTNLLAHELNLRQ